LKNHVLAIESDNGAFDPTGFGFTGSDEAMRILKAVGESTGSRLKAGKVVAGGADADTGPLLEEGVPVAALRVAGERYFWYHHTEADTPEKVDPDALNRCAAALAILVYTIADLEQTLPR
jgi:carboxypeptidase Q